ncbi:MAG TPA: hypothetical protein VJC16_00220 [Candidatus Nanoarchaeia archaeon]|nr:hypothetical protein [Candidatus Nanoarchaeia archaeon]
MSKILLKSSPIFAQVAGRIRLIQQEAADGLELYGSWPVDEDLVRYAAQHSPVFHFEPQDYMRTNGKGQGEIYDLTDVLSQDPVRRQRSREFIETSFRIAHRAAARFGREEEFLFNVHWIGNCNVSPADGQLRSPEEIAQTNADLQHYYFDALWNRVGIPRHDVLHALSFENVYQEAINGCPAHYTPIGRTLSDFPSSHITIDVAHKGMDMLMTIEAMDHPEHRISKGPYAFAAYPQPGQEIAELLMLKSDITQFIISQVQRYLPRQVHLTNFKWIETPKFTSWKDGSLDGMLDLPRIIPHLRQVPFIVTEVHESLGDYVEVPDQVGLANMIRKYL